jgi:hypothetical protein
MKTSRQDAFRIAAFVGVGVSAGFPILSGHRFAACGFVRCRFLL